MLKSKNYQQIHLPMKGIFRIATAATAEIANVHAAVANIAPGVESLGMNAAESGARMNMCIRYIP